MHSHITGNLLTPISLIYPEYPEDLKENLQPEGEHAWTQTLKREPNPDPEGVVLSVNIILVVVFGIWIGECVPSFLSSTAM